MTAGNFILRRNISNELLVDWATQLARVLFRTEYITPLVIPNGKIEPMLFGTPYTMWIGLLFSFIFLGLTLWGIRVYPKDQNES